MILAHRDVATPKEVEVATAFTEAASRSHRESVLFLCQCLLDTSNGYEMSQREHSIGFCASAAFKGDLEAVQLACDLALASPKTGEILGVSCVPWLKQTMPLYAAATRNSFEILKYLFQVGLAHPQLRIHLGNNDILVTAALNGNEDMVRYLCDLAVAHPDLGISFNPPSSEPWKKSVLEVSCWKRSVSLLRYLCEFAEAHPELCSDFSMKVRCSILQAVQLDWAEGVAYLCGLSVSDPAFVFSIGDEPVPVAYMSDAIRRPSKAVLGVAQKALDERRVAFVCERMETVGVTDKV